MNDAVQNSALGVDVVLLGPVFTRETRGEMQVGSGADRGLGLVRNKHAVISAGQGRDPQRLRNPPAFHQVRLYNRHIRLCDEIAKLPPRVLLLARGDGHVQGVHHLRDPGVVVLRHRLLIMNDAKLVLEAAPQTDRG